MNKYLYGTDINLIMYRFKIVNEDNEHYYVQDVSTSDFQLYQHIFKVDKKTLEFIPYGDDKFDFIFKEDKFKVSFDESYIQTYVKELINESKKNSLMKDLPRIDNNIKNISSKLDEFKEISEVKLPIYKFQLSQEVLVLIGQILIKTYVEVELRYTDKILYGIKKTPELQTDGIVIPINTRSTGNYPEYYVTTINRGISRDYLIFLNSTDYENYKKYSEYFKLKNKYLELCNLRSRYLSELERL